MTTGRETTCPACRHHPDEHGVIGLGMYHCECCEGPKPGREATADADFHAECWTHHPEGTPCPSGRETTRHMCGRCGYWTTESKCPTCGEVYAGPGREATADDALRRAIKQRPYDPRRDPAEGREAATTPCISCGLDLVHRGPWWWHRANGAQECPSSPARAATPDRRQLPVMGESRNVPPAQRLLRDGGLCSCFWRLSDGTPVICAMPSDVPHRHEQP